MSINGQRTSPPRAYHIFQVFVMLAPQLISAYKAAFFPHACNSQPRSSNCFYLLSGLKVRCMMHGNTIGALQSSLAAFIKRVTIVSSSSCKILFQSLLSIVHPHVFHLLCVSTSLFHFLSNFFFLLLHNPILFSFLLSLPSFSICVIFCCHLSLSQYWTSHAVIFLELCSLLLTYSFVFLTRYEAHTTTSTALRQAKPPPVTAGAVVVRMTPPFRLLLKFRLKVAVSILFMWFFFLLLNVSLYMNGTCFLDIWEQMRSFPSLSLLLFTLILLSLSRSLVLLFIVS